MTEWKDKHKQVRRSPHQSLSNQGLYAMGFVELQERADEDGWPYEDGNDCDEWGRQEEDAKRRR